MKNIIENTQKHISKQSGRIRSLTVVLMIVMQIECLFSKKSIVKSVHGKHWRKRELFICSTLKDTEEFLGKLATDSQQKVLFLFTQINIYIYPTWWWCCWWWQTEWTSKRRQKVSWSKIPIPSYYYHLTQFLERLPYWLAGLS